MKAVSTILGLLLIVTMQAQDEKLPYYEITEESEVYTAGTVAARVIDGLGFRYYWATEGLRDEDLAFRPSDMARTTEETIDHILGLSKVIVNSTLKKPNVRTEEEKLTFAEKRKQTLINIKTAADILRASEDLSEYKIIFKNDKGTFEYPFWNNLNGPIGDALWHCGQVISFRRSSGNPYNSKAGVFVGKVRE
ncbi:hypothetical protein MBM09_12465 [Flaviramulus sp. BrNp1-15]|uniref:hypothetical protein n=1 Tax=Flaviramulus sp. BrNp1-15 TaxID=2916754 RepID=UPI001EE89DF7|nr:hypothetical protein [Flaviramulus sp. BrNp1-15]ULC58722.1 hypothetical protein MBM09_12465 [Flaviramulus sp. BrNp1-15]